MADKSDLVATFEKNSHERVQISLDDFKGRELVNVRIWYKHPESGDWLPGRQGFALSVEKFDALMTGLNKVGEKIREKAKK